MADNTQYISNHTGITIDSAASKALTLPSITALDSGKILIAGTSNIQTENFSAVFNNNYDSINSTIIDSTLTQNGKAADAKITGEKFHGVEQTLGVDLIYQATFESGYISTAANGSVMSFDRTANADWVSAIIPVVEGDKITLTITGAGTNSGTGGYAYAIVQSNQTVISKSARNAVLTDAILIMPAHAAYLVVNNKLSSQANYYAIKGETDQVEHIISNVSILENAIIENKKIPDIWAYGYINGTDGVIAASSAKRRRTIEYLGVSTNIYSAQVSEAGQSFFIYAYDSSNNYIGVWQNNQFVSISSGATSVTNFNFCDYPDYKFYIVLKNDEDTNVTEENVYFGCLKTDILENDLNTTTDNLDKITAIDYTHGPWQEFHVIEGVMDEGVTSINGSFTTTSTYGSIEARDNPRIHYIQAPSDGYVYVDVNVVSKILRVSREVPVIGTNIPWTGRISSSVPSKTSPWEVKQGEYIAISRQTSTSSTPTLTIGFAPKTYSIDFTEQTKKAIQDLIVSPETNNVSESFTTAYLMKQLIPAYWFGRNTIPVDYHDIGYLEDKIQNIPQGYHFIFITDVHWNDNATESTKLISYIRNRIGAKIVLFGGDVLTTHSTKPLAYRWLYDYIIDSKNAFGNDYLPTVGNHDLNASATAGKQIDYAELVPIFTQGCDDRFHYCDFYDERIDGLKDTLGMSDDDVARLKQYFRTCYYVDDKPGKTRFIVYNTGAGTIDGGSGIQTYIDSHVIGTDEPLLIVEWLYSVLMSTPNDYNVILCSHIPTNLANADEEEHTGRISEAHKDFAALIPAAKGRVKTTISFNSSSFPTIDRWCSRTMTFDFRQGPQLRTVAIMGGHYHTDGYVVFGFARGGTNTNATNIGSRQYPINATSYVCEPISDPSEGHYRWEIPVIYTQHDAYTNNASTGGHSHPMQKDTTTEQCFDVVTVNDNGITLTRIGAGNNRFIQIVSESN